MSILYVLLYVTLLPIKRYIHSMRKKVFFEGIADVEVDNSDHFSMASRIRYKKVLMDFERLLRRYGELTVYAFTLSYRRSLGTLTLYPDVCVVKDQVSTFLSNVASFRVGAGLAVKYTAANIEEGSHGPHAHVFLLVNDRQLPSGCLFESLCFGLWKKVTRGYGFFYDDGNYSRRLELLGQKGMTGRVSIKDGEKIRLVCEKIRYNTKDQKGLDSPLREEKGRLFMAYAYHPEMGRLYRQGLKAESQGLLMG